MAAVLLYRPQLYTQQKSPALPRSAPALAVVLVDTDDLFAVRQRVPVGGAAAGPVRLEACRLAQAPTPPGQLPAAYSLTSPPSVPPTLLQQTSSNYVLELSLAILAAVYFQPAYQAPSSTVYPPSQGRGEASPICSLSPNAIHPSPATRPPTTPSYRTPQKEPITPLTPQSPRSERITPVAPVPPTSACLPPRPPTWEADCVLPSRSDLARHLSLLGAIGSNTSQPETGSMRWFLTELFKRAAVPGLIIRVAAGYVLRCRIAIAHALRSVAIKSLSCKPGCVPERTARERVLTDARRVFLAALVLACKFVFDKPYDNRSWSLISGLGSKDIGECERVVGEVLEWRLWIGAGRSPSSSS
ncbi:hypothetical protein RhiJN_12068 [Ceratobasidium sp. AG-Ba]|nr:hypothetical protein RhiJN_12068 [Ceratobasidium sp. AG-Ba]